MFSLHVFLLPKNYSSDPFVGTFGEEIFTKDTSVRDRLEITQLQDLQANSLRALGVEAEELNFGTHTQQLPHLQGDSPPTESVLHTTKEYNFPVFSAPMFK